FGGEAPEAESGPGRRLEPVRRRLADGSHLVLTADQDQVSAAQRRLRRVVGLVGLGAIVVTGVALVGTVRVSLRPLETMAEVARSIARGDRGRRLAPDEPDTELGRTAVAFDQMVDALEGAERQARESEARTRRFLADAAHELRTPIAGVQAAAEVLVQAGPEADPAERERMQVLLAREARRAGRLVTDLLALARIDAGLELRGERVDLLALAEHEAERVRLLSPGLTV
ncbi:histidine kinase dimerization/phospho-acceptor domain-containing protein, partial [Streptomyces griseoaurantiacus]